MTSLAYDPSGLHLAVGYQGGVSLEACGIRYASGLALGGTHTVLAWSRDGSRIAAASAEGVALRDRAETSWRHIEGLHAAPRAIAFSAEGALIVGGADFVQYVPPGEAARDLGAALAAPIACHPALGIIACGDAKGRILLRRIGMNDELCIREASAAPISLAFAPDGQALAFAAADGEAGTVLLPDLLFRNGAKP